MTVIRLGTRASLLATAQSQLVARAIERAHPSVTVELIPLKTTGDIVQDRPLAEIGGKGLFTKELELALLEGRIDLAVHSYKDVPVTMPLVDQSELVIACVPAREDPRDCLVTNSADAISIETLPPGARVGTGSLRRKCQVLAIRPDLQILPIRGNIDTRLNKLADEQYDAVVLAIAGLSRSGLVPKCTHHSIIPFTQMIPSAGQGALAIQIRRDHTELSALLAPLHSPYDARCVNIEREIVQLLNGDCYSPIGVVVSPAETSDKMQIHACIGASGGGLPVRRASAEFEIWEINRIASKITAVLQNARN